MTTAKQSLKAHDVENKKSDNFRFKFMPPEEESLPTDGVNSPRDVMEQWALFSDFRYMWLSGDKGLSRAHVFGGRQVCWGDSDAPLFDEAGKKLRVSGLQSGQEGDPVVMSGGHYFRVPLAFFKKKKDRELEMFQEKRFGSWNANKETDDIVINSSATASARREMQRTQVLNTGSY